jgi:hypothetical protein
VIAGYVLAIGDAKETGPLLNAIYRKSIPSGIRKFPIKLYLRPLEFFFTKILLLSNIFTKRIQGMFASAKAKIKEYKSACRLHNTLRPP